VKLTPIVSGLDRPVALAVRKRDAAMYIAQQSGKIVALVDGKVLPATVLDIHDELSTGNEQGLLGITFSPDGSLLYIDYTDTSGDTHVQELPMQGRVAVKAKRREILKVNQPAANHNGGEVIFGPDNMLYIGLGDGGNQGDPQDRGQNLNDILAKILRINPVRQGASPYSVPADNPFVSNQQARPETWMYGLRNPWRFTFDRSNGDMWIGDVGQNAFEEIDYAAAGEKGINWGWSQVEGLHRFKGANPAGARLPIFETSHTGGYCAIVGGYVYRGKAIPSLDGVYLFSDNCVGKILALDQRGGKLVQEAPLGISANPPTSFGEDANGELYVLSYNGTVSRFDPA
jgi:glucose/arabinose dehydrogenase